MSRLKVKLPTNEKMWRKLYIHVKEVQEVDAIKKYSLRRL